MHLAVVAAVLAVPVWTWKPRSTNAAAEAEAAITKEEKKEARLNYKKIKDRFKKDRIARQQRINDILSGKFGINNPYGLYQQN